MNSILYDLDVDYEVVSNNIDFDGTKEIPVEEESEASSLENTFIQNMKKLRQIKIVDKKASELEEINLDDSFFEPQFEIDSSSN